MTHKPERPDDLTLALGYAPLTAKTGWYGLLACTYCQEARSRSTRLSGPIYTIYPGQ